MKKLDKVELWSQQTWRRLNGRALVNNSTGFNVLDNGQIKTQL